MQKVLVAGATGYLGKYVAQEFKKRGFWVRALVRNPKKVAEIGPFLEPKIENMDEIFTGDVTKPETLKGLCDGIDFVFSSVGLMRQGHGMTFQDVDYQGNKAILTRALESSVKKFVYVSAYNAHLLEHLSIVKAHEDFVREIERSGIDFTVMRPTGYFSDISEYLSMAESGRAYLIGDGENGLNPIHGADLAKACVDAFFQTQTDIPIGGPKVFSQREIAALAFRVIGKKEKITKIPIGVAKGLVNVLRLFSKHQADLFDFFVAGAQLDFSAPPFGSQSLTDYFQELHRHHMEEK